jgi:hypothetical protein
LIAIFTQSFREKYEFRPKQTFAAVRVAFIWTYTGWLSSIPKFKDSKIQLFMSASPFREKLKQFLDI